MVQQLIRQDPVDQARSYNLSACVTPSSLATPSLWPTLLLLSLLRLSLLLLSAYQGMKVKVARTGRVVSLSRPQQMFAQSRATVQEGFAGDVIGLTNPGAFAIGDTLYAGETAVCLSPLGAAHMCDSHVQQTSGTSRRIDTLPAGMV